MAVVSKRDVKTFIAYCVSAYATYLHSKILFESGVQLRNELLEKIAPIFFHDISRVFVEYNILQICKLTDSEESRTRKGKRKNLTVDFFIKNSDFSKVKGRLAELKQLSK